MSFTLSKNNKDYKVCNSNILYLNHQMATRVVFVVKSSGGINIKIEENWRKMEEKLRKNWFSLDHWRGQSPCPLQITPWWQHKIVTWFFFKWFETFVWNVFLCFLWKIDYIKISVSIIPQIELFEVRNSKNFLGRGSPSPLPRPLPPLFLGLRPRFGLRPIRTPPTFEAWLRLWLFESSHPYPWLILEENGL